MRLINDKEVRSTLKPPLPIECVIEIEGMVRNSQSSSWLLESSLLLVELGVTGRSLLVSTLPERCALPVGRALEVASAYYTQGSREVSAVLILQADGSRGHDSQWRVDHLAEGECHRGLAHPSWSLKCGDPFVTIVQLDQRITLLRSGLGIVRP